MAAPELLWAAAILGLVLLALASYWFARINPPFLPAAASMVALVFWFFGILSAFLVLGLGPLAAEGITFGSVLSGGIPGLVHYVRRASSAR